MCPEDSEVNLMYILTKASRRDSNIFEIFSTRGTDQLVASRNRWVKYHEQKIAQQERLRSKRDCKEEQERMATKATFAGLKQVKGWQEGHAKDSTRRLSEEILRGIEGVRGAKEALVLVQKKHKLMKMEGDRGRTRTMQRLEVTSTTSPSSGGQERLVVRILFFVLCTQHG